MKQLLCGCASILLSVLLLAMVEASFLGPSANTTVSIRGNKAKPAILPVTLKYRGADVSAGGGSISPEPESPLDLYHISIMVSAIAILGTLSTYLLVRWNKKDKLRAILKSLREQ